RPSAWPSARPPAGRCSRRLRISRHRSDGRRTRPSSLELRHVLAQRGSDALRREGLDAALLRRDHMLSKWSIEADTIDRGSDHAEVELLHHDARTAQRLRYGGARQGDYRNPQVHRLDEWHREALMLAHTHERARHPVVRDKLLPRHVSGEHDGI